MTEHELRSSEGTQVPDPRMVTIMSGFSIDTSNFNPVINFKNESIFWTLFIFMNAELGNLGIEGLRD